MIDKIIRFSIQNKITIAFLVVALMAWGGYSVMQLPIDAVPDITNNQVQVITVSPSLAAQEIERLITYPVEITMATIPGIDEIRSFSRFGLSVVTIVFNDDIDVYWARQQVNERLVTAKSQIPAGTGEPEMAPLTTGLGEIYQYVLHTKEGYEDKYSAQDLRTIQDWIVRRQLLGTPGVADVSSFGGRLKIYEITVNPDKLRSMNVSIKEIFTALETNNQNTGGAYIDKNPNAYFIRSEGLVGSLDDIRNIVVKNTPAGMPVLISDLGKVSLGTAVRYGASTRNGQGEVVSAVVMMLKGANSAEVISNIKKRIEKIKTTLPEGVVIEPFLDRTKLVNKAISTVATNLIEGALIVIFILILLLGNIRAGLIVASVIPLAMLFAFGMMHLFGVSGNLMSLGAIDFGLIVDGAVIIVESIIHHLHLRKTTMKLTRNEMNGEVYEAASRIRSSAAFGEIIILIVYLPILALVGIEGKMFRPMAQTVSFAILGAFLLSLTYVPMMSAAFLSRKPMKGETFSDRLMRAIQRRYQPLITWSMFHKKWIVGSAVVLFLFSLLVFNQLGGEFIPTLDEGDFAVETRVLVGSSLSQTINASTKAEALLLSTFPEIKQVVSKIGSGEIPTDPMPIEACDMMVILKDKKDWVSAKTTEELADKMSEVLATIPGVTFGFQHPIQMRFNELMTGARQDVVIKIYGEDLDVLSLYANEVGKLIGKVDGAEDLYIEQVSGLPQIQVEYDREAMAKYGLDIQSVNEVLAMAFAGKTAGRVYEGQRRFDLVVRLEEASRKNLEDVSNLFIPTNDGHQIPLNQVAEVTFREGPSQIQRDDTKRRITVGFNVRNRDVESVVDEIRALVDRDIDFPVGYFATYGGQFENLIQARKRLAIAVPTALLLIFFLLYLTLKSFTQSMLIFTAIPLSAIGGIFALSLRGMPFSISAGVGFIALFGVAVLNGIVLIAEFNRLKAAGIDNVYDRVFQGNGHTIAPGLMTALVASFGFLPMALLSSSGAEVQRPLATVVIGGLITATFLTLFVLPALYILFDRGLKWPGKKVAAGAMVLLFMIPFKGKAQQESVSLDSAIAMAIRNNPSMKSARLDVEWNQAMKKTSSDIGKTQFNWQHGQYNSYAHNDNYFAVTQTFAFPTVYMKNANIAGEQVRSSELQLSVTENQLKAEVKSVYYQWQYAQAQLDVLLQLDSIYADFQKASDVRYRSGESNLLEKSTAEVQLADIRNKMKMAEADVVIAENRLKVLLHADHDLQFEKVPEKKTVWLNGDTTEIHANPELAYYKQQIDLQKAKKSLEKNKLLPDLTVGYFNQSMIGPQEVNGVEKYFGPQQRFTGFQVGIALPIWVKPYASRIRANDIQIDLAASRYDGYERNLESQFTKAYQELLKQQTSLEYYEGSALPQAAIILENARKSYKNGSIGYVEFTQSVQQSMRIRLDWLSTLNQYNQAIIQLEYLAGQDQ